MDSALNGKADWIGNYGVSVVSRDGGAVRNVSPSLDERVLESLHWSQDGRFVYALANEGTARRLFSLDVERASSEALTEWDRSRVSTGLRIHVGTARKPPKQRAWRKLHIAVDRKTGNIVASELTASRARDATRVPALLTQIQAPLAWAAADSAYDRRCCTALAESEIRLWWWPRYVRA